jgi:hypothetical protein
MSNNPGGALGQVRAVVQPLALMSLGLGVLGTIGMLTTVAHRARFVSTAIVVASLGMGLIGVFSARRGVAATGIVLSPIALLELLAPIGR